MKGGIKTKEWEGGGEGVEDGSLSPQDETKKGHSTMKG